MESMVLIIIWKRTQLVGRIPQVYQDTWICSMLKEWIYKIKRQMEHVFAMDTSGELFFSIIHNSVQPANQLEFIL